MNAREAIIAAYHALDGRRDMSSLAAGATARDIANLLADQEGNRGKRDPSEMGERWVQSAEFVPAILPVKMLHPVRIPSGRTKSFSTGPIVVEINFRAVEQIDPRIKKTKKNPKQTNGFIPAYVIIDGQHRWYQAVQARQEYIHALVGVDALQKVNADLLRWVSNGKA